MARDSRPHSRVHRLPSFDTATCFCWVKRDDELGFGISGSKVRKYHSLLPFLLRERFEHIVVLGGINSNNALGLAQILTENRLPFTLYLRGDLARALQGNGKLTVLIAQGKIRWLSGAEWKLAASIAREERKEKRVFVIPEGASCPQAREGALTLAADILKNEEQLKVQFSHIFVDAGTGFTANTLIEGVAEKTVHVINLAKSQAIMQRENVKIYRPRSAPSFGATNRVVWNEVARLAKEEGILLDPVYTAKLFYETRCIIKEQKIEGDALVIHSGGALSLLGFSSFLDSKISSVEKPLL